LLAAAEYELFRILKVAMAIDSLGEQPAGIEWRAVGGIHDANMPMGNHRRFCNGNAKQIGMDRPQAWRQRSHLYSLDASLLDESDRILEVVMGILRAIRREDPA